MPRGFERNIVWDSDPEKQPRYAPELRQPAPSAQAKRYEDQALAWAEYDLGFLASLRIKAD